MIPDCSLNLFKFPFPSILIFNGILAVFFLLASFFDLFLFMLLAESSQNALPRFEMENKHLFGTGFGRQFFRFKEFRHTFWKIIPESWENRKLNGTFLEFSSQELFYKHYNDQKLEFFATRCSEGKFLGERKTRKWLFWRFKCKSSAEIDEGIQHKLNRSRIVLGIIADYSSTKNCSIKDTLRKPTQPNFTRFSLNMSLNFLSATKNGSREQLGWFKRAWA